MFWNDICFEGIKKTERVKREFGGAPRGENIGFSENIFSKKAKVKVLEFVLENRGRFINFIIINVNKNVFIRVLKFFDFLINAKLYGVNFNSFEETDEVR